MEIKLTPKQTERLKAIDQKKKELAELETLILEMIIDSAGIDVASVESVSFENDALNIVLKEDKK